MTSSNGNIFRVTGPLCGEFTGPGEFPAQRPVTRSFDVFFDLRPNKRLSKQSWDWWFETPSWSLWRQCNEMSQVKRNSSSLTCLSIQTRRGNNRYCPCCSWMDPFKTYPVGCEWCTDSDNDIKLWNFTSLTYSIICSAVPLCYTGIWTHHCLPKL